MGDCHGVRELLLCWFGLAPLLLVLRLVILQQFWRRAREWSHTVRRRLLYARYHASLMWRGADSDYQPLGSAVMVSVTVRAVSGATILTDFRVLSQDYVHVVKDATLQALGARDTRCQLINGNTLLEDNQRLAHVGVKNGSQLLCILSPEPVEEINIAQHEVEEGPTQKPPIAAKAFICIWLCGWFVGEFHAVSILEQVALQCVVNSH